ncbi:hypothetical protein, partial [Vibrio cincinnatiensis]|uniref:hypothetical protein n=1 Tax=Vibrio cincinnatiensis TaxID=675 RepID=UPI001EDCEC49
LISTHFFPGTSHIETKTPRGIMGRIQFIVFHSTLFSYSPFFAQEKQTFGINKTLSKTPLDNFI